MSLSFIHLRSHTQYSLGESSLTIKKLVDLVQKYNMPALAITDSSNMFGVREFSKYMIEKGIKPLIGMEVTVTFQINEFKENSINSMNTYGNASPNNNSIAAPVVLLAKNIGGYLNLLKLHQKIYSNRKINNRLSVDLSTLCNCSSNLILLSGGNLGFLGQVLLRKNDTLKKNVLDKLKNSFSEDFYIELNRFSNKEEIYLEDEFLEIAKNNNVPIVATGNPFFSYKEDFEANDILMCIGQGVTVNDIDRNILSEEQYFKSQEEMKELFSDLPEALENTIKIAKKCNFAVEDAVPSLPFYAKDIDEIALLTKNAQQGLNSKLEQYLTFIQKENPLSKEEIDNIKIEYSNRLAFEINVIAKMNFAGYFLIVADFINWAKSNNIPVGPGRGSGAGSLVAWALNITGINPMKFGLFFERFLNPERISMPDFDIDFCQKRRDEVINYVVNKYGNDKVAQIITFGSLQTRAALRDVGRVLGIPYASVDKICKRIPHSTPSNPVTISKVLKEEKELSKDVDKYYMVNNLFSIALKLENLYRNTSTHAAGIVISLKPLVEVVPLYQDDNLDNNLPAVGFSMKYVEEVGLVKFDFLGLKTLTVIQETVKRIKEGQGVTVEIEAIPLYNEQEITNLLASGKTLGIFQLESLGMRDVLMQLKPDKIEDIIAIISLYRPGPMENIPVYINRKHGKEKVVNLHPLMDDILKETFGIMIYQEQVMQIAQKLAGYSLGEADLLRRAMGKKQSEEMAMQKNKFLEGALKNNIDSQLASKIFEQMAKFAGYGFNKSHAAAYAFISWQTAYLKAHYPADFIAESMTYDMQDVEKLSILMQDAKDFNIQVIPPDINYADPIFVSFKDKNGSLFIRYSILAAKGTSKNLIEKVKEELSKNGKFKSIEDFLKRIPNNYLNKKQIEALIKSGSFDSLDSNRGKLLQQIETLVDFNSAFFKQKNSNQVSLFDNLNVEDSIKLKLQEIEDMPVMEKLVEEASVLGFFISGHPLSNAEKHFSEINVVSYSNLIAEQMPNATIAVVILKIKISKTRNNDRYMTLSCSDVTSNFNIILFGKSFYKFGNKVQEKGVYKIQVSNKFDGTEAKLFVENLQDFNLATELSKAKRKNNNTNKDKVKAQPKSIALEIVVSSNKYLLSELKSIIESSIKGDTSLILKIRFENGSTQELKLENKVSCTESFISSIEKIAKVNYIQT